MDFFAKTYPPPVWHSYDPLIAPLKGRVGRLALGGEVAVWRPGTGGVPVSV